MSLLSAGWRWRALAWSIAMVVIVPLGVILSAWITPAWEVWHHLADTVLLELVMNTLILLFGVTAWVLLLGVGLAWLTAIYSFPGRRFFDWALLLPLAMPAYVLAFAMLGFLDYASPLQLWLTKRFGNNGYWFPDPRSPGMVVFLFSLSLYPYVYMLARTAFLGQGQRMLEASRMLGRSPWGAFFHAALPMARPAIAAGCALAAMEALADFGAVSVFGFNTFTTAIYKAWFGLFNLSAATQLASLLLLFVIVALSIERRMRGRAKYFSNDAHARMELIPLHGVHALLACGVSTLVLLLAFGLPMGQLLIWAWHQMATDLDGRFRDLVIHTVLLGGFAALLSTLLAFLLGLARKRHAGDRVTRLAAHLATLGYALPGSLLAVGVMLTLVWLSKWLDLVWPGGWGANGVNLFGGGILALLFAYLVRFLAVANGPVESGLETIRPSLMEAARSLGSSSMAAIWRIEFPILRPGLLTAILLVMVEVMKEMPATLLLRPFGWDTLAVRIHEMTSEGEWERAALPAVTLVLTGLLPLFWLVRRSGKH
ncbi:MAG: iron ABC transporter permease [Magnetococcales bacterium]|nr:iron ABC transporter permease [Magnetococcales bacterium]MBF0438062.1 iron ABC transporter permease [Magnetococcales bacterium]